MEIFLARIKYINNISLTLYADGGIGYFDSNEPHYIEKVSYTLDEWNFISLKRSQGVVSMELNGEECYREKNSTFIFGGDPISIGGSSYWPFCGEIARLKFKIY